MTRGPLDYFKIEAQELLEKLTQEALTLRQGGDLKPAFDRMMRAAHTLKGAARVVQQKEIADLSHELEEVLSRTRDTVSTEDVQKILAILDGIAARVHGKKAPESLRVESAEIDALLYDLSGLETEMAALKGAIRDRAGFEELLGAVQRLEIELQKVRNAADVLRCVPVSVAFTSLRRVAHDTAASLGKEVELVIDGPDARVDSTVLTHITEALTHLVTNAVAHGIEAPAVRETLGKPRTGRLQLRLESRGHFVHLELTDDGQGIDESAIRKAAIRAGLASEPEADRLGFQELIALLLRGGITTAQGATQISGRGVGLSAAAASIYRAKGDLEVTSEPSRGSRFKIRVPNSIEASSALELQFGGLTALIPIDRVAKTMRSKEGAVIRSGSGASLRVDDRLVPFARLSDLYPSPEVSSIQAVVVVRAGAEEAALGVDRIARPLNIVTRPLPASLGSVPLVSGATLNEQGDPVPVLDAFGLVERVRETAYVPRPAAPARKASILVVDDSLTTRMLERHVLEAAGYAVELAGSGEDAVRIARTRDFDLFVIDVEMPGMNGFELVRCLQADAKLRKIPVIMLSSRQSVEDRAEGLRSGARAYLVKSEFEEREFLRIVREWIR